MKKIIFSVFAALAINFNIVTSNQLDKNPTEYRMKMLPDDTTAIFGGASDILPALIAGLGAATLTGIGKDYNENTYKVGAAVGLATLYLTMDTFLTNSSNGALEDRAQTLFDIYPSMIKDKNHPDWKLYCLDIDRTHRQIARRYNSIYKPWNWTHAMKKAYLQTTKLVEMTSKA